MTPALPQKPDYFAARLQDLGRRVRGALLAARAASTSATVPVRSTQADVIYPLDSLVEPVLEDFCRQWSREFPLVLIAEGIQTPGSPEGVACFPTGSDPSRAAFRLIVDPIDGTRELMHDKRSAWVLAGVAPNHGAATRLSDIQIAIQVEIPVTKQTCSDVLCAIRGGGVKAQRDDLITGARTALVLSPSTRQTIEHGFCSVASFFPGTKNSAAELFEFISRRCLGEPDPDKPLVFDDQYISTGGQLYELIAGHDLFIADVRPLLYRLQKYSSGIATHPYDMAALLVAQEAGVIVTDGLGGPLDAPLDVTTPLSWAGFANAEIHRQIQPLIVEFFQKAGLHV